MAIKKAEMTGAWNPNIPLYIILPIYFFVLYPTVQFFGFPSQYAYPCFQALSLVILTRRVTEIGWSALYLKQHLLIGGVCGAMVVGALPLLDVFSSYVGLETTPVSETNIAVFSLLLPLLEQSFFSGLIAQSLFKKINPVLAVYLTAVIFTLAHFTLNLGTFFIGLIATGLFYLTGTLYAPLVFHIGCQIAWVLLRQVYPHLITLLGFLF